MRKISKKRTFLLIALTLAILLSSIDAVYTHLRSRRFAELSGSPINVVYVAHGGEISEYYGDGLRVENIYPLTTIDDPIQSIRNVYMHWPSFFLMILILTIKYFLFAYLVYFINSRINKNLDLKNDNESNIEN